MGVAVLLITLIICWINTALGLIVGFAILFVWRKVICFKEWLEEVREKKC